MKKQYYYISVLNVIAAMAVVVLHCNFGYRSFEPTMRWQWNNFLETICYWAVPIFFMNCGVTTMEYRKRYSTADYFKKRLLRIGVPFLVFSMLALLAKIVALKIYEMKGSMFAIPTEEIMGMDLSALGILRGIFETKYIEAYWFFIPLFVVYLCIPILTLLPKQFQKMVFLFVFDVEVVIYAILPFLQVIHPQNLTITKMILLSHKIMIPYGQGFLMYVLLGYFLQQINFNVWQRLCIYFLGILGWGFHFVGTWSRSVAQGVLVADFKGYTSFPTFLFATAVFLLVKTICQKKEEKEENNGLQSKKYIQKMTECTFGVYLIHMFYLQAARTFLSIPVESILWPLVGPILIFGLSYGTVKIYKLARKR